MTSRLVGWSPRALIFALKPAPADQWQITQTAWLRALGLIYLCAFAALWFQIIGLIGSHGISPASEFLTSVHASLGARAFWRVPSLLWMGVSDGALLFFCAVGCCASLLLIAGYFSRLAALVCFSLYLSLVNVGQPFTNFQWDALLLEAGFLAIFAGAPILYWAYRFLLFRLMFESGVVKLTSHDPNWRNLHALRFHFFTQPLPTPLAYYANQLPGWLLDGCTGLTFFIELIAPFLLFGPGLYRRIAGVLLISLQLFIAATGNYAFFNLLTLALCLWAFDDQTFARLARLLRRRVRPLQNRYLQIGSISILAGIVVLGFLQMIAMFRPHVEVALEQATRWIAPFEVVNSYGLFAVMTTSRNEIIIEGSNDGQTWREYQFRYKPGDVRSGLRWIAPYQPRLDWQMWFAALGSYQENPWCGTLFYRLLTNETSVQGLLEPAPFRGAPRYLRASLYEYTFTTPAERAKTGTVWNRKYLGTWFGPVSLRPAAE